MKNSSHVGAIVHAANRGHDQRRVAAPRRTGDDAKALMLGKRFGSVHVDGVSAMGSRGLS